jgi:spore germination protein GerM
MTRAGKITLAIVLIAVAGGIIYVRGLHRQILRLARPAITEEQARRQVTRPQVVLPGGTKSKAQLFWLSEDVAAALEPEEIELALPDDPAERARELLIALIEQAPAPERRTLPVNCSLLEFYLLKDGTAVADFSGELATSLPSGIESERLAVESILLTLGANVPAVKRLKILILGQEVDSLAGHLDISEFFPVKSPVNKGGNTAASGAAGELTAAPAAGKLNR